MARCPFATWRPLPENATAKRIKPTQYVLHSAVDSKGRTDLWRYFARDDVKVESHFWIYNDGTVEQFLDTEVMADCNRGANVRAVSVETEDDGRPDTTLWTPAQIASLIRLGVWLHEAHGIPAVRCATPTSPGIGFHSMWGAPSEWTPARGKTCPGTVRISQVPGIIRDIEKATSRASAALKGPAPTPINPPAVPTSQKGSPMLLLKCDDHPHVYLTDGLSKRHLRTQAEVGFYVNRGVPADVHVRPHAEVEGIPNA